jgi:hypothetical protein
VRRINEELDAASGSWLPCDEARPFEGQYHLVNRGWAHAEILLHVGFGRRPAVQARVEVNIYRCQNISDRVSLEVVAQWCIRRIRQSFRTL